MSEEVRLTRRLEPKQILNTSWQYPALKIEQSPGKIVYCFSVNGNDVHHYANITRIAQDNEGKIIGYQRPEVQRHIQEIKDYIDSESPMIPNAIVLSFDKGIKFIPSSVNNDSGILEISLNHDGTKPGFIVDGQQRLGAIRDSNRDSFKIFATAFITTDIDEQREQFVLVNNVKPLQKSLIYELIPDITGKLPPNLQQKKISAHLTMCLDGDQDSPFFKLVKRPTNPTGIIKDTIIQKMIENSIKDGALRCCANIEQFDFEGALYILKKYWNSVKMSFPNAWALSPKDSRLSHGVGISSLGSIMDLLHQLKKEDNTNEILHSIADYCAWTEGYWEINGEKIAFNTPQNISRDIRMISQYLQGLVYSQ
jgi:DNA sulfur modification protein DndB